MLRCVSKFLTGAGVSVDEARCAQAIQGLSGRSRPISLLWFCLVCALSVLTRSNVLHARSTPCDCELHAPGFLAAAWPFLLATAVINGVLV